MTHGSRRLALVVTAIAMVAGACAQAASSAAPSTPPMAVPSATPTAATSATATATATPTAVPTPSPSQATECVVQRQTGNLPSDRFTDIKVSTDASTDRLSFVFGNAALEGPAGPPKGSLEVATPPYTQGASGAPIDMIGDHVLQVRFSGMSLSNDVGQETYQGPPELKPNLPALRHAVLYDATEGIVGWYVGYDGPGCVTLDRSGNTVTVTFDHP